MNQRLARRRTRLPSAARNVQTQGGDHEQRGVRERRVRSVRRRGCPESARLDAPADPVDRDRRFQVRRNLPEPAGRPGERLREDPGRLRVVLDRRRAADRRGEPGRHAGTLRRQGQGDGQERARGGRPTHSRSPTARSSASISTSTAPRSTRSSARSSGRATAGPCRRAVLHCLPIPAARDVHASPSPRRGSRRGASATSSNRERTPSLRNKLAT